MFKNLFLPLLLVLVAVSPIYWAASSFGADIFQAVSVAILAFCALLTLYNHFRSNFRDGNKFALLQDIFDLEKEFDGKIKKLKNAGRDEPAETAPLTDFETRLAALEETAEQYQLSIDRTASTPATTIEMADNSFDTASNPNVIPLGTATRRKQEERRIAPTQEENLPAGLNLEDHFHLFLHPIFEIPEREVSAITAMAGLYDVKKKNRHIFRQNGLTLSGRTSKTIIVKSIQAVALAMHEMQKHDERVPVIMDITAALVGNSDTWETVQNLLKNDKIFEDMFVAQINMKEYLRFSKAQKDRFARLRELGLELCIGNCSGLRDTVKLIESNQFQNLTISASELMRYDKDKTDQISDVLIGLANDHSTQVIATGLESEAHVVAMLDFDVNLAQGPMLSEPLLSKIAFNNLENISKDA